MNVEVGPALLWQILELRVHHGAALFCLPLEENKNEQRNAGITTSVRSSETWKYAASFCGGNSLQPCTGRSIGRSRDMMKHTNSALKYANDPAFPDLREAVSKLRTANDAICVLVSALTYQVTAQTLNQHGCDYCGERYQKPGPIAWTSHHCNVLVASETIISQCVQQLLRERAVVKNEIERYLPNRSFLRPAM